MLYDDGKWKVDRTVIGDPKNKWEFKRVAIKYKRRYMEIRNSEMKLLSIETFLGDVIRDGTCTVYVSHKVGLDAALQTHQEGPRRKLRN